MSDFAVYAYDSVESHNLLALQAEDDVFTDMYQMVTARIHVDSACFKEEYQGPRYPRKPYLEIMGNAQSLFLEDSDSRIFPCGAKNLTLMGSYPVRVKWVLEIPENATIVEEGYGYEGFDIPPNLIGNTIEIPLNIKYYGVYESPIAIIEILHPNEIMTCTRENQYFGFFNSCAVSPVVEAQKLASYEFYPHTDFELEPEPIYAEEVEQQVEEEVEQSAERQMEADEDQANLSAVEELIKQQAAEAEARRVNAEAHKDDRKAILARVNERLRQKSEAYAQERETSLSDAVFGAEGNEDRRENIDVKATYEDFKAAAEAVDAERIAAEKDADESRENARKVDRAIDNQLLNAGVTDVSGFNSDASQEFVNEGATEDVFAPTLSETPLTPEQIKEKEDKKSGKAQIDAARKQDIAADNKALNEGIDDIAGQGANTPRKPDKQAKSAADLIAGLDTPTQSTPQDDGTQFL